MPHVDCDTLEVHAGRVHDRLEPLLEKAKAKLAEIDLKPDAMGSQGDGAVESHNQCKEAHIANLKKGIQDFKDLSDGLKTTAKNWRKADESWVEKGTPGI